MVDISNLVRDRYLKHKSDTIMFYDSLLKYNQSSVFSGIISVLKKIEAKHINEVLSNKPIRPESGIDLLTPLSLTPINELNTLSNLFEDILSFKGEALSTLFDFLSSPDSTNIQKDNLTFL